MRLKAGQVWRPNRGKWRTIQGIGEISREVHYVEGERKWRKWHWCYYQDFQDWIKKTNAKLVREE